MNEKKIVSIENKLLKKEKYLRHARRVAIQLIFVIIATIVLSIFFKPEFIHGNENPFFIGVLVLIFWWWEAHLQVRHIESIKYHRKTFS